MRALFLAALKAVRPPKPNSYVYLRFEDGTHTTLGPMDRFSAELFVITRISPHPYHTNRRVVSSRILES